MRTSFLFITCSVLLLLTSCHSTRNLVYFSDLKANADYSEAIKNKTEPVIQPDDLLSITISSLSPETNTMFNSGIVPSAAPSGLGGSAVSAGRPTEGYLVDREGMINFPVLGKVKLAGLTKQEATDKMTAEVKNHVRNPIVNLRFLNFKVTVVGEVSHPSSFIIPTERISIIEALGLAGDLTPYGKRENVLIIREKDGMRQATRVDLTSKSILNSPDFYLQQNDIVYVEPIKAKALQGGASSFYVPLVTAAFSLILSMTILLTR